MTGIIPSSALSGALERVGMSQAELARLVHVDRGQVSRWVNGRVPLRGANADRVVAVLLERGVELKPSTAQPARVFLATPMAALDGPDYEQARDGAAAVAQALARVAGPVYWPGGGIRSVDRFEAPDLATAANLDALERCEAFVLCQLAPLTRPTSCHVELGWALAQSKPVTVFAPDEGDLPYMLHRFEAVADRRGGRYRYVPVDDAVRLLNIHGAELLGLPAAVAA